MCACALLRGDWDKHLATLAGSAQRELTIVSPFITRVGVGIIDSSGRPSFRNAGRVTVLTDLSPLNICQSATDPNALQRFSAVAATTDISHLPRLHAKVYIADFTRAIVTSANLTTGG